MTPERARELLGGLATGILTDEERNTLFEAALNDQALFNEVADELEFASFLQSPDTRSQLANRIDVPAESVSESRRWWSLRPAWLALSGVVAATAILSVVIWRRPAEVRDDTVTPPYAAAAAPQSKQDEAKPAAPPAKQSVTSEAPPKPSQPKLTAAPAKEADNAAAPRQQEAGARGSSQGRQGAADAAEKREIMPDKAMAPSEDSKATQNRRDQPAPSAPAPPPERRAIPAPTSLGGAMLPRSATPPPVIAPAPAPATRAEEKSVKDARDERARVAPMAGYAAGPVIGGMAVIEGIVHDPNGAAVPNVAIEVVNTATGANAHTVSDASGRFATPPLSPGGSYTVTAEAPGFVKEERSLTLASNQPAHLDIPLRLGTMTEAVQVTASAATLSKVKQQGRVQLRKATSQVAVLDFVNGTLQSQSGQQAADLLASQLVDSGQVGVIDREKVQQAWQAQSQSQTRTQPQVRGQQSAGLQTQQPAGQAQTAVRPSNKELAALGKKLGADAVIVGSVQPAAPSGTGGARPVDTNPNVAVSAEVIDTKKARPTAIFSANGTLRGATNQVGLDVQSQLGQPLEGTVTRVDQGVVTVSFQGAADQGIAANVGARMSVYRGKRRLGDLTLTSASGESALGKFSGTTKPQTGDRVTSAR